MGARWDVSGNVFTFYVEGIWNAFACDVDTEFYVLTLCHLDLGC